MIHILHYNKILNLFRINCAQQGRELTLLPGWLLQTDPSWLTVGISIRYTNHLSKWVSQSGFFSRLCIGKILVRVPPQTDLVDKCCRILSECNHATFFLKMSIGCSDGEMLEFRILSSRNNYRRYKWFPLLMCQLINMHSQEFQAMVV